MQEKESQDGKQPDLLSSGANQGNSFKKARENVIAEDDVGGGTSLLSILLYGNKTSY
ncbi:hypothetical protein B4168_1743 [Anoxybacillus flavithermus]|nr:hypothetical protein B4168_1743 [Anoxybacillus flavithermus]OAO87827.1 hypothetical protein GT23_0884 [Parageobacillus thermoglucosidasius]